MFMEPNTGSFGAATGGGGNAIAAAMQRRGIDASVLNQVTPAAPTSPDRLPPQPVGQGAPSAVPQRNPLPAQRRPGGLLPNTRESIRIIDILDSRLKTLGELEKVGIQV